MLKAAENAFAIDDTNDEPKNAYATGKLNPKTPEEVFKERRAVEAIQETAAVQHDEMNTDDSCISTAKKVVIKAMEQKNDQRDLSYPSVTTEDTAKLSPPNDHLDMHALDALPTGISNVYTSQWDFGNRN